MLSIFCTFANVKKKRHGIGYWMGWLAGGTVAVFLLLSVGMTVLYKYVPVRITPLMLLRKTEARKQGKTLTVRRQWIPLEQISPEMVRAVIASEDNLFLSHHGFSERGIRQALQERLEDGHVRHGGSTITQQTAKNVFCTPRRSYVRKAFEAYFTVLIEWIWGKERIMEVYLNVIETGDGVFGVEPASLLYFGHTAKTLNRKEAALIAVCLPNPRRMHADRPSAYVRKRQAQIVVLMPKLGPTGALPAKQKNVAK